MTGFETECVEGREVCHEERGGKEREGYHRRTAVIREDKKRA